jgi:Family of unknown function (DUF6130)
MDPIVATKPVRLFVGTALVAVGLGPLAFSSLAAEAKPRLVIESPAKGQTMEPVAGLDSAITVKWRVENFRLAGTGEGGAASSKQLAMAKSGSPATEGEGFVHVSVDNGSWFLVRSSNEPIVVAGFNPGSHKITLELVGMTHQSLSPPQRASVSFTVGANQP